MKNIFTIYCFFFLTYNICDGQKSPVANLALLDYAHYNNASSSNRALGQLLQLDGFSISKVTGTFTKSQLDSARLLIIVNPLPYIVDSLGRQAQKNGQPFRWSDIATKNAFTETEVFMLEAWVREGGSLFLVIDHAPYGKTSESLAAAFGVATRNVATYDSLFRDPTIDTADAKTIIFTRSKGLLGDHPILNGVDSVTTFTGESLLGPSKSYSLLILPASALDQDWISSTKEYRNRSASGRVQGIALEHGRGRVVILGETAITSESGIDDHPNRGNRRFIQNILTWLERN